MTLKDRSHFPGLFNEFFMAFVCSLRPFYHKRAFKYPYKLGEFRDINHHQNELGTQDLPSCDSVFCQQQMVLTFIPTIYTSPGTSLCWRCMPWQKHNLFSRKWPSSNASLYLNKGQVRAAFVSFDFSFTSQRKFRFFFPKKGHCNTACFEHD